MSVAHRGVIGRRWGADRPILVTDQPEPPVVAERLHRRCAVLCHVAGHGLLEHGGPGELLHEGARALDHERGEPECGELVVQGRAEVVAQVNRACRRQLHPDQAVPLGHRQLHQATLLADHRGERLAVGDATQRAVGAIGPAVVRAGERAAVAGTVVDHPHPAMAAHVQERLECVVLLPQDNHRYSGDLSGEVVAGVGQLGGVPDRHRGTEQESPVAVGSRGHRSNTSRGPSARERQIIIVVPSARSDGESTESR